jgi:hypothetical protein
MIETISVVGNTRSAWRITAVTVSWVLSIWPVNTRGGEGELWARRAVGAGLWSEKFTPTLHVVTSPPARSLRPAPS